jgi:putative flippase GtrA
VLRHFLSRQFAGFLAVGGLAALLHWLSRVLLSALMPYSAAVALAYVVGMSVAFVLNSYYVFPTSDKPVARQARDFVAINLAFFPVVWVTAMGLNEVLPRMGIVQYSEEVAHALAISLPVLATFLLYKFYAFREKYYG